MLKQAVFQRTQLTVTVENYLLPTWDSTIFEIQSVAQWAKDLVWGKNWKFKLKP